MPDYDIITVGGGLGGASFAKAMAERGARVLVLEREAKFKDRVRGEWLAPWGVAEAQELGVYETLISQCGYHPTGWDTRLAGNSIGLRDNDVLPPTGPRALGGGGREGRRRSENGRAGRRCPDRRYAERYAPEQRSQRVVDYAPRCRR